VAVAEKRAKEMALTVRLLEKEMAAPFIRRDENSAR
jgi:hypothetical protein